LQQDSYNMHHLGLLAMLVMLGLGCCWGLASQDTVQLAELQGGHQKTLHHHP
jgi:hypothetical protein